MCVHSTFAHHNIGKSEGLKVGIAIPSGLSAALCLQESDDSPSKESYYVHQM